MLVGPYYIICHIKHAISNRLECTILTANIHRTKKKEAQVQVHLNKLETDQYIDVIHEFI